MSLPLKKQTKKDNKKAPIYALKIIGKSSKKKIEFNDEILHIVFTDKHGKKTIDCHIVSLRNFIEEGMKSKRYVTITGKTTP